MANAAAAAVAAPPLMAVAQQGLLPGFTRLESVWRQLGLPASDADARRGEVVADLAHRLEKMAIEEERQRDEIVQSVEESRARVLALERELDLAATALPGQQAPDTSLVELDAQLQERCDALEAERERRLEEKVELESRAEALRRSLELSDGEAPDMSLRHDISMASLERLREIVGSFERQLQARRSEAEPLVRECQQLMAALGDDPIEGIEALVQQGMDHLVLSTSTMEQLRSLRQRLESRRMRLAEDVKLLFAEVEGLWKELEVPAKERTAIVKQLGGDPGRLRGTGDSMRLLRVEQRRLQALRRERLPLVFAKALPDLHAWWDKCYTSQDERATFFIGLGLPFPPEAADVTEFAQKHAEPDQLLQALDEERQRCQEKLRTQGELYKAVDTIEKYRTTIANVTEEDRLRNRGGLIERLSKMEKAAQAAEKKIAEWEEASGQEFKKDGVHYLTQLQLLQEEEKQRHLLDQEERRRRREEEVQREMMYGAVPATPKRIKRNGDTTVSMTATTPKSASKKAASGAVPYAGAPPSSAPSRASSRPTTATGKARSRAPLADANAKTSANEGRIYSRESLDAATGELRVTVDSSLLGDKLNISSLPTMDELKKTMDQAHLHSTNLH